ncbi:MAG: UDP-4-amino-4,6-dideoxy-N-acetyl-beta-L-altrosamine transaminase [Thalassolituus oleivorans]|uniref:UDP-4-amino-4, 6-dideoxy-N-acetyl-beta-L-altrosamine transaminase n=1 Tax=Thalassolituus oleivorans TaxID=187493 RepID=UPI001B5C8469|nr:UDP-4-amino-4,6-dideoxy-N-acetyl-beta-L-altrosamine transaminase [Thalassolituus oleivorans]MBQ0727886.1 UDP-4-amino-4,6-dideoxy-N-acetyl-beta-L-altrosamine transaminase [Thalassolituus oleivorans]MBQ0780973.1 UDP-4-amino-4,6-dideoxy-N-acetyl-beta-L-altrosamine transaminase [Thalassolituus oleivorans]
MIPYGKQDITQGDIDAVIEVLGSDFLTQGPVIPRFEDAVKTSVGAGFSVAVNSATSALHIACLALDLGPGDRLWTSPITFVASANCALYCNASVDFVDIDPTTYNLCPQTLEQKLIAAELAGVLPKIVVPVHLAGQSCDMKAIKALSDRFGFRIIEDASHAIGAAYGDEKVGSCHYSDITVFSFHPVKIITTAEGGMAVTNDPVLAGKMERLRSHGITRDPHLMTHAPHGPWYYQQIELGFNYRMTEMQAALGCSQMTRLHEFIERRQQLAAQYAELLNDLPLMLPYQLETTASSWHLYIIRLQLSELSKSHLDVFNELRSAGIGVNLHYIPVHLQPYYRQMGFADGDFPHAEQYYQEAISIPLFHAMTDEQQLQVATSLRRILI